MSINELESEQKDWALSMLCRSGVLSPCRHHEGVYVDEGIDIESAYKYSMKVYKKTQNRDLSDSWSDFLRCRSSIFDTCTRKLNKDSSCKRRI